ncbi:MAG: helix-turn-helix domain-containing protein [Chloroflexi bacterium]|nr:helix-turn-helix domain-containing protein [Chloroflexota bacterium]
MKPKIIKNEADYVSALAHIEGLMDSLPGTPDEEELELFAALIENYEDEHFPIDMPDPVEAIKFRMEQQGLNRKDLVQYIGSQSKVSEVLNGKRPLSISMIRALEKGLGIPAEILLQEPGETRGQPDPEPIIFVQGHSHASDEEFSGEINLQIPESLYRKLTRIANRTGIILNEYISKALESLSDEVRPAHAAPSIYRQYPGLSRAALQLMSANGMQAEANRSDELLFGQWLKQKVDDIEKCYTASEFEECTLMIENILACLVDNTSESPIIEGLVRVMQFQKSLMPSYLTNAEILHATHEKVQSQIEQVIGQVYTPRHNINAEDGVKQIGTAAPTESILAVSLPRNAMVAGQNHEADLIYAETAPSQDLEKAYSQFQNTLENNKRESSR